MPSIHKSYIDESILLLELDNPPANTLSKHIKNQFITIIEEIEQNDCLRVIIITGRRTHFCSGGDLKENLDNIHDQEAIIHHLRSFTEVIERFEALPIPIIGAINGWCIGGGFELALCCDIRVAVPEAQFVCAGVNVGLTTSAYRLPRLIGTARAKRMLLTGSRFNVDTALEFGLVTDIFEKNDLLSETIKLAKTIASKAPLAVKTAKQIANKSFDLATAEGLKYQQEELEKLAYSQDYRTAVKAFIAKEKPQFNGI